MTLNQNWPRNKIYENKKKIQYAHEWSIKKIVRMWCYEWKKSEALRVGRLNLDSVVMEVKVS